MNAKQIFKASILFVSICASSAFAEAPKEAIRVNPEFSENQVSADIQGQGNKIIDQFGKANYAKFYNGDDEYAYKIRRFGSNDISYTGNKNDIKGVIFLDLKFYKNGFEVSQVSSFKPSKYLNAIRIVKMSRDDERAYEFEVGLDSDGRLYIINNKDDVTYLEESNEIKKYVPRRDRPKKPWIS